MSTRDDMADLLYTPLPVDHDDETLLVGYGKSALEPHIPRWGDAKGECARIADAILAAGYRPPARTVSTVEEAEAVQDGSLLYSPKTGDVWTYRQGSRQALWSGTGGLYKYTDDLLRFEGELTVLREGRA